MPLFQVTTEQLDAIAQSDFESEKRLQQLIEKNLVATFNCRFIASEVSTGEIHRGRIDTLALSEENNPVIIEYKKMRSPELFTQSFFYLGWLRDHKGDFEVLVRKALAGSVEIDWSDIRVICLARDYSKYERVAIREMGGNIELWQYRLFANSSFYLEEIHRRTCATALPTDANGDKDPIMVAAGKKAALTRATSTYTFQERITGKPMREEASDAGRYTSKLWHDKDYPRLQILTIEGLLNGTERVDAPPQLNPFAIAARESTPHKQTEMTIPSQG